MRSCAALYQAWTWAPKRNQVFSASLISRDGPSSAKAGRGAPVARSSGLAGAVSGACGFSVCDPVGAGCADAAAAANIAINDVQHDLLLAFEILPMSSSFAIGCGGRSPSRTRSTSAERVAIFISPLGNGGAWDRRADSAPHLPQNYRQNARRTSAALPVDGSALTGRRSQNGTPLVADEEVFYCCI